VNKKGKKANLAENKICLGRKPNKNNTEIRKCADLMFDIKRKTCGRCRKWKLLQWFFNKWACIKISSEAL
jgi:ribosomal protein L37E